MKNHRIVITGIGTINPLGKNVEEFYQNFLAGKSGIRRWESLDMSALECQIGGDMGDFDTKTAIEPFWQYFSGQKLKNLRKLFRSTTFSAQIAILTSLQAWEDAGLFAVPPLDFYRISLPVAGHNFNSNYIFQNYRSFEDDPEYIKPLSSIDAIDPNLPAVVSETFGLHGPAFSIGGACASGNLALRQGCLDIYSGECDSALVVAPPFDVSPADIQASIILSAVVVKKEYQHNPQASSRPFDKGRCGFLYSHGGATVVIETLERALARNAKIYGEILGVAANANANHMPIPGAEHQEHVMKKVLAMANLEAEQIDYVNCHATGTYEGDLQEILALRNVFGPHIQNIKLNAPKSMLGHTCWASPLVETVGALKSIEHGKLPPTINLDNPAPEIEGLEFCANKVVEHQIDIMLKNSFGFGGINCCSLIRRFTGA